MLKLCGTQIFLCVKCPKMIHAETSAHSEFQGLLGCNMYYYVFKEAAQEIHRSSQTPESNVWKTILLPGTS